MKGETASSYKPGRWWTPMTQLFFGEKNPNDTSEMRKYYYENEWGGKLNDLQNSKSSKDALISNNYDIWLNEKAGLPSPESRDMTEMWKKADQRLLDTFDQVAMGNWTKKMTTEGTITQILLGLTGVDLPLDLRDIAADIKDWNGSKEHITQTVLDVVGILPLIGAIKNAKKVEKLFGDAGEFRKIEVSGNATQGLTKIDNFVDLTGHRKDHILNRHSSGAGIPEKTEFPASWNNDRILHQVSDVAADPNAIRGVGKWDSPYAIGVRDGIEIRVDFYPSNHPKYAGQISTAYPTNVPANPAKP